MPRGVHYAWVTVVASLFIEFFGLGFGFFALIAAYPYFEALGWSRTVVVGSSTVLVTVVAILSPLTGAWMDRRSVRVLFAGGGLVMSVGHLILGFARTPLEFYAGAAVLGIGMSGVTILPNQVLISRWFRSRLGLANGLISAGTVLGGSLSTMVVTLVCEAYGRAVGFAVLAALVGVFPPLLAWLVVRDRPADLGLEPWTEARDSARTGPRGATILAAQSIGDAARQPAFWWMTIGLLLATVPCYTSNKHLILYLRDLGLEPTHAAAIKSSFILVAGGGRLIFGALADHVDRFRLLTIAYLLGAVGFPLVFLMPASPSLIVYPLVFGLAYGGVMPMMPIMIVECFGVATLGTILGWVKLGYDAAAAGAPLAAARAYDVTGNYHLVFVVTTACAWLAVGCAILLEREKRRVVRARARVRSEEVE